MGTGIQVNAFDVLLVISALAAARAGYRSGAGESLWLALRFALAGVAASLAAVHVGAAVAHAVEVPVLKRSYLIYVGVLIALILLLNALQRRISAPITNAIPPGWWDHLSGGILGMVAVAGVALIAITLVFPAGNDTVDWNPTQIRTDQAVGELGKAVMTSVRRFIVDESATGRWVVTHFSTLLLPTT